MADGVAIESTSPRRQVMRCDALVGKSILYNWPVVGWCVGQVVERNTDAFKIKFKFVQDDRRRASKSQLPHLLRDPEIDQQAVKTVLRLEDYDSGWVLLASVEAHIARAPIEPGPHAAIRRMR